MALEGGGVLTGHETMVVPSRRATGGKAREVRTLVVLQSGNEKTGRATVTYRTQDTCPTTCPLMGQGCYARGRIFGIPERLGTVDDGQYGAIRALVDTMPRDGIFRANVSGDMLDESGSLDTGYAEALSYVAMERGDTAVFTYSHAWRRLSPSVVPGVTINASCDSPADLEAAVAAGWPTVVTDPDGSLIGTTIAGRKVVQCPSQTKGLTCAECRLCARPERKATVAFALHGSGKKIAAKAIAAHRSIA